MGVKLSINTNFAEIFNDGDEYIKPFKKTCYYGNICRQISF